VKPTLRSLRRCFEGAIPASIATCGADGMPNIAKLSHVQFVDDSHVALSYQFFNKTRENILHNARATVEVVDPVTAAHYLLKLTYLRTETEGPLFEYMKARLAAIASHTGMTKVFRLLGSDIYQVTEVTAVPGHGELEAKSRGELLTGLRACMGECMAASDLAGLLDTLLEGLDRHWGIRHAMVLMLDPDGKRLYTVASRGYAESGVGSEVRVGEGIVGVAASAQTPIRIGYAVQEYRYSHATRERFAAIHQSDALETEIPFPGLAEAGSQLAVPMVQAGQLRGVLYVESPEEQRFTYEHEDALVVLTSYLVMAIETLSRSGELPVEAVSNEVNSKVTNMAASEAPAVVAQGAPVVIRHYREDRSVFVDNDYLIKGVAGAILWKLVREHAELGRSDFTNRELRLDATLGLPDVTDNLDARLILLQRRLAERCPFLGIEKTGRGRFRLNVARPLQLTDDAAH